MDSSDVYADIDIIADFAFKYSADNYVGFERFSEINHEIFSLYCAEKKCKYKKIWSALFKFSTDPSLQEFHSFIFRIKIT